MGFVQSKLKKSRKMTEVQENSFVPGEMTTSQENVVDEVEHVASSTLREKGTAPMKRLLEVVTVVCYI